MSDQSTTRPRFYVYTLARPDGRVFYVGKGSGVRIYKHEQEARSGHACYKCNVIRQILEVGAKVEKRRVFETNDESAAFAEEMRLIAAAPPGLLTNLSVGGIGGASGVVYTEERRRKVSEAHKGRPKTAEHRAALSASKKANPLALARWAAVRPTKKGQPLAPAHYEKVRAAVSAANKGRPFTAEHRAKLSANKTAWHAARRQGTQGRFEGWP